MSNQIVPVKTGALALQSTSGKPNISAKIPESKEDKLKAKGLVTYFRGKFLSILGNKLLARLGIQSSQEIDENEGTIKHTRVNLLKLQGINGFISTTSTAYELLFGDMSHVIPLPYADLNTNTTNPEVERMAISKFNASQKSHNAYRFPPLYSANFGSILEDTWMKCNTTNEITPNTQFAISSAMDLQMNVLLKTEGMTVQLYKEMVRNALTGISQLLKNKIQVNPKLLKEAYGLEGEVPVTLIHFFLDSLTPEQLVMYTTREFLGGVSHEFNTVCLETVLESVGTEYLYKFPSIDRRKELRMGPYLLQPNRHLSDIKFANEALLSYGLVANNIDSDEYKRGLFKYTIDSPHDTFVILLVDRFLQYVSFVEKSIPNYQKSETDEPLQSIFKRLAKKENTGYLSVVRSFFENRGSEGIRQLIRILMAPSPMDEKFSADILAWMQQVEEEGLMDYNDFMEERLLIEKDRANQIGHVKENKMFQHFVK